MAWLGPGKVRGLDAVAEAWNRYSYRNWEDIEIPRHSSFYGDALDWILFRIDNAHRLMKWRVDTIKSIDPIHPVTAHGYPHWVLSRVGPATYQPWKAAELVDVFGHSGGCNHEEWSRNRWEHWLIEDMTRSSCKGKPFWHAEMPAGYTWRAHGGPDMDNGRMAKANDIKLYSMIAFAGAHGCISPLTIAAERDIYRSFRLLQHGWVAYRPGRNEREDGHMGQRAGSEASLGSQTSERGSRDHCRPESQIQCWLLEGSTDHYSKAARGAYQGFLFNSVQADFVMKTKSSTAGMKCCTFPTRSCFRRGCERPEGVCAQGRDPYFRGMPAVLWGSWPSRGKSAKLWPGRAFRGHRGRVHSHLIYSRI